jgi:predicted transcriptional regulator
MTILLSIKPEFANKIFDGSKLYEYRRVIFKNKAVSKVVVYASAPISKVIGEFEVDKVLQHEPQELWNKTKDAAGISKNYFLDYFEGKKQGYAIKVGAVTLYKDALCLLSTYGVRPPQSFQYLN